MLTLVCGVRQTHRAELKQVLKLNLAQLQICGGITGSVFPEVDRLLQQSDYQQAMHFVAGRKNAGRYRSVMDFLFCEIHTEWRGHCQAYYRDSGPPLREQIDEPLRREFARRMVVALEVARRLHDEERCRSWGWYVEQVEVALAA